jgi:spore maturation protein CgeB
MFVPQLRLLPFLFLRRRHPAVYGVEMYRVLGRSRITLNAHAEHAQGFASNNRMFEATGMGALLATEASPNLPSLFEPDREVIAYESSEELVDKIGYYLAHESERERIAEAGRRRTSQEHSSEVRARQVLGLFAKHGRIASPTRRRGS